MQSDFAHGRHRIMECTAKGVPGSIACVVIKEEQAQSPYLQITMAECCGLHGGDRKLLTEAPSPLARKRLPSVHEISGKFEVRPCHAVATTKVRKLDARAKISPSLADISSSNRCVEFQRTVNSAA